MKKGYDFKVMSYLLIIAVIPLLIISTCIFIGTQKIIVAQVHDFSNIYLKQAINATDIVLKQVSDSCKQMALDEVFAKFETFYRSSYYEERIEKMDITQDLEGVRDYVESKANLFKRMSALKLSNEFVESVYLVDVRKKVVYTDLGMQYPLEEFGNKEWIEYIKKDFVSPEFIDINIENKFEDNHTQVVTLLIRSYYNLENIIVVNLDAKRLHHKIKSINEHMESILFAISPKGNIVFAEEGMTKEELQCYTEQANQLPNNIYNLEGQRYSFKIQESGYTGWKFILGVNLEKYLKKVTQVAGMIVIITAVCLIGVIGGAFILTNKLYQPIDKLFRDLGIYKKIKRADCNEFDTITHMVSDIQGEREILKKKLEYSLPVYKEKFIYSLLIHPILSKEIIYKELEVLDSELKEEELAIIILTTQMPRQINEFKKVKELRNKIDQIIENTFEGVVYELLLIEEDKIILLVNKPEGSENECFERLELVYEGLLKQLGLQPIIAVSRWLKDFKDIKEAFIEVDQFFNYLLVNNKVGVSGVLEGTLRNDIKLIYPRDRLELLSGYLRNGDLAATKVAFGQILNQYVISNEVVSFEQAQFIYFEVLSTVIQTLSFMGLDITQVYGTNRNLHKELITKQGLTGINEWFEGIFEIACVQVNEGIVEHKNKHVAYIIQLLEKNCGHDISLEGISDELGLNANYLSRVFKEVTGEKFIDYLTQVRVEKSIELLRKGDKKIKEIAEQVGYPNANYFIKVFREYNGITPGEFKKLYNKKIIE